METGYKRVFLGAMLCAGMQANTALAEAPLPYQVIDPLVERREIKTPDIDTEDFEVGVYGGLLSIQDFDTEVVYGIRAAWHITEDFFMEASYGESEGDLTSYEELSGGSPLFEDADRDYSFYTLALGYNILPGEIFAFGGRAFKSDLYVLLGAGSTDFLGDKWFTATGGVGYRLLMNDWIAWHVDVRDHIFDRDTFGESEITHNIELSTGMTFFF